MTRQNPFKAWFLAARPKTLAAGATPVVTASALAFHDRGFQWLPAVICLLFAILAQIISNFANDYFDAVKGSDNKDRLGPKRAVAEGWIAPKTMLIVTLVLCVLNSALGLTLLLYGGWFLIPVGIAVVVFALAYSGGPYPLAYRGWGDVCVFVFFGIVPVDAHSHTPRHTVFFWNLATTNTRCSTSLCSDSVALITPCFSHIGGWSDCGGLKPVL